MSRSDRNVGRNANHDVPLQEFFKAPSEVPRRRGNNAVQAEERPNERIEVRINLNQTDVPVEVTNALERNNMALTANSGTGIIIISGIPPENGFGQQQVLDIVKGHVPNAALA